ncbi:MAG TPA: MBL fold metallo-hydrolase [Gammaproteobacteria bacterium]|nr:MBL fold metallo-hydrolase [Gammaproteobacteria bacterium]
MQVKAFPDRDRTWTVTYLVYDENSKDAVVIDPILDLDTTPWRTSTESVDAIECEVSERQLKVHWILDTHVHADHLSGAAELKRRLNARTAIGARICRVQEVFKGIFNLSADFPTDGRQFDRLLEDGDIIEAGKLSIEVLHTPGHTPACCTYRIGDALFTGDVLFLPDVGVARCDFPDGSAHDLYHSVKRLYALPNETRVFVGHDYPSGRDFSWETTIAASKAFNADLPDSLDEQTFVRHIQERDATMPAPRLLFPSLQVNIRAGELPEAEDNGTAYLKIPLNSL